VSPILSSADAVKTINPNIIATSTGILASGNISAMATNTAESLGAGIGTGAPFTVSQVGSTDFLNASIQASINPQSPIQVPGIA
jgi:hypothetical protein